MNKIILLIFISLLNFTNVQAQCWFTQFQKDFETGNTEFKKYIGESKDGLATYQRLYDGGSNYVLKNATYLKKFEKLTPEAQLFISKLTDNKAGETLAKFLDDSDNASFLKFVNDPKNDLEVRGFLAHKSGKINADENRLISEMLDLDEFENPLVKKWLEYGDNMAAFKANREAGNAFGKLIESQLADVNSEAYKVLKKEFAKAGKDLDDYTIYSQVQFCITGDCLGKGNFWIPDFVAVIEKTKNITKEKYLETIIIDSKLSKSTDWTKNQKKAIEMDGWEIKYTNNEPIVGKQIYNFDRDAKVNKDGTFIKLFKENESIKTTR